MELTDQEGREVRILPDSLEIDKIKSLKQSYQLGILQPNLIGVFLKGECFKQLPSTNDPRHTDDAVSVAGATDGTEG